MSTTNPERKFTFVLDDGALTDKEPTRSGLTMLDVAAALLRRKRLVASVILGSMAVGVMLAFALPTRYTATAKILPPEQSQSTAMALLSSLSNLGGMGAFASLAGRDLGIKNPNDLYVSMLKSRTIADALIQRFDLQKVYHSKDMSTARRALASKSRIVAEKEGFISISVDDGDKKRAANLTNGYVEELRNLTQGLALTEASQRRLFYEQQLKQAKEDLATAEIDLKLAQQKSGVIQLDAQAKAIIEAIGRARAAISLKRVELQTIRMYATDESPMVVTARRELAAMQAELDRLEKQSGGPDTYEVALKDVPGAGVQYIRALREMKYRETLFEVLARQYEAARLDESKNSALIQVFETAVPPDRRSFPLRTLTVALTTLFGLFVGVIIVGIGQWKLSLQADPERVEKMSALRAALAGK